jgi:hypothetical protein
MPEHPSGTVTFLFTDIEGSTPLWERDLQAMVAAARACPRWHHDLGARGGTDSEPDRVIGANPAPKERHVVVFTG